MFAAAAMSRIDAPSKPRWVNSASATEMIRWRASADFDPAPPPGEPDSRLFASAFARRLARVRSVIVVYPHQLFQRSFAKMAAVSNDRLSALSHAAQRGSLPQPLA